MAGIIKIPILVWLDSGRPPSFRMVGLFEVLQYFYGRTLGGPPVPCMFELFEDQRLSYGLTLKLPPVFVWLDSLRPSGFRLVGHLEAHRFSNGCTPRDPSFFV